MNDVKVCTADQSGPSDIGIQLSGCPVPNAIRSGYGHGLICLICIQSGHSRHSVVNG